MPSAPSRSSTLRAARLMWEISTAAERRTLAAIVTALFVRGILETFAVASVMPFIALVSDLSIRSTNGALQWLSGFGWFPDERTFLVFVGVLVLLALTLSNAFAAWTTWVMERFIWEKHHRLSLRLLEKYVHEPYTYFLDRNTSDLTKNIFSEVTAVIDGVLVPLMQLLARGIVSLFLLGLLFAVDWAVAGVVVVVLGGTYGLIYAMVRRRQSAIGVERQQMNARRFRSAMEALEGIKPVKVAQRETEFVRRFSEPSSLFARHTATDQTVAQLPRFALESVAFGGVLLIVIYFLGTQADLTRVLPLAAVYAFAAYKLMPSLQLVFQGMTRARFSLPSLEQLHRDLEGTSSGALPEPREAPPAAQDRLTPAESVRLDSVSYSYPGASALALDRIDITVQKGSIVGLVGHTGSGKSTVADVLLGLLAPDEGALRIDGAKVDAASTPAWRRALGYVPQEIFLCDDSITGNVAFGVPRHEIDADRVAEACRSAGLEAFIASLPAGAATMVGERGVRLSGGQRQRIGIARALYHDPDVLVLDEATSALDGETEDAVMESVVGLAGRRTIILIAHRLRTVRRCDRIYLMDGGRAGAVGSYAELMASSETFRRMAGESDGNC